MIIWLWLIPVFLGGLLIGLLIMKKIYGNHLKELILSIDLLKGQTDEIKEKIDDRNP